MIQMDTFPAKADGTVRTHDITSLAVATAFLSCVLVCESSA